MEIMQTQKDSEVRDRAFLAVLFYGTSPYSWSYLCVIHNVFTSWGCSIGSVLQEVKHYHLLFPAEAEVSQQELFPSRAAAHACLHSVLPHFLGENEQDILWTSNKSHAQASLYIPDKGCQHC